MKKNIIGHMMAAKEPVAAKIRRWNIIPKFLCLLLALLIWLTVVNVGNLKSDASETDDTEVTSES